MFSGVNDAHKILADETVLVDYCRIHSQSHEVLIHIFEDEKSIIVVSDNGTTEFRQKIGNLQKLYDFIFRKSYEIKFSNDSIDETIDEIVEEVLDFEVLNENIPLGLNPKYIDVINKLEQALTEQGFDRFVTRIDTFKQEIRSQEEKLERSIIDERISRTSSYPMVKLALENILGNEIRAKILVDAIYWNHFLEEGHIMLIRDDDPAIERKDDVIDTINRHFLTSLELYSPKEIATGRALD